MVNFSALKVLLTTSCTHALEMSAILCDIKEGDEVIMPSYTFVSTADAFVLRGARIKFVDIRPDTLNIDETLIEEAITENTRAIVCTHGSNLTGNMIDISAVGAIAEKHHVLFVVDASQTAGVFPVDVQKMKIDILCFTGHKSLRGPQGTGGMYVRTGVEVRPLLSGGSGVDTYNIHHPKEMPTALEAGTLNGHGIAGLNAALSYLEEIGMDSVRAQELSLMRMFYEGICGIPGVKVYGDFETRQRCPIVSFNIGDYDSSEVSDELFSVYGIATRPGAHCAPLMHKALGTKDQGAVRFSFSHYNTEEEVQTAIEAVRKLAED